MIRSPCWCPPSPSPAKVWYHDLCQFLKEAMCAARNRISHRRMVLPATSMPSSIPTPSDPVFETVLRAAIVKPPCKLKYPLARTKGQAPERVKGTTSHSGELSANCLATAPLPKDSRTHKGPPRPRKPKGPQAAALPAAMLPCGLPPHQHPNMTTPPQALTRPWTKQTNAALAGWLSRLLDAFGLA